jgi:hypothetical protein
VPDRENTGEAGAPASSLRGKKDRSETMCEIPETGLDLSWRIAMRTVGCPIVTGIAQERVSSLPRMSDRKQHAHGEKQQCSR